MIAVIGAMVFVSGARRRIASRPPRATSGLTKRDIDDKRAYSAAQAGIADYSFHLNNDNQLLVQVHGGPEPERRQPDGLH